MTPSDTQLLPTNYQQMCRLCGDLIDPANPQPIYSPTTAADSLDACIANYLPIEIQPTDPLPLHCCTACSRTLRAFHTLHSRCQLLDAQWRRQLATAAICPFCPATGAAHLSPTVELLQLHLRQQHPDRIFHCDVCAQLIDRRQLLAHMTQHAASLQPPVAKPAATTLTDDGQIAAGAALECDQCDRRRPFATRKALAAHRRHVHDGHRPFECPECGDRFAYKRVRDNHVRAKHGAERLQRCPHCAKSFKTDTVLYAHCRRLHPEAMGSRSGVAGGWFGTCDRCGRGFGTRAEMVRHLATHSSGPGRWPCPYCCRRFAARDGRTKHVRTHTVMTREFRCRMCRYAGAQRRYLVAHMRNVHQTGLRGD